MKLWSGRKKKPVSQLNPESLWTVTSDDGAYQVVTPEGDIQRLAATDLSGVAVETNDTGPWGADVWWLLFGSQDKLICSFPQGATGEQPMINRLMTLPGFDHDAMVRAMSSTGNANFPVWRSTDL